MPRSPSLRTIDGVGAQDGLNWTANIDDTILGRVPIINAVLHDAPSRQHLTLI